MALTFDGRRKWGRRPGKVRERDRLDREPVLVPVSCAGCGRDLAEVIVGGEAFCATCKRWTSTFDTSEGMMTR